LQAKQAANAAHNPCHALESMSGHGLLHIEWLIGCFVHFEHCSNYSNISFPRPSPIRLTAGPKQFFQDDVLDSGKPHVMIGSNPLEPNS
jgi:hypothetical protein